MAQVRSSALVSLLLMAAGGCSDDCPTLQACDIRSLSCQLITFEVAQCVRGATPGRAIPAVHVVDADTFIDSQVEDAEPASDQTRASQRGLALLGLFPDDADPSFLVRARWNQIGAFFSSESGEVTVLDRSGQFDSPSAVITLVHEFVHSLQAIEGKPDPIRYRNSFDGQLALGAIQEGEAELYADLAAADGYGFDRSDVGFARIFRKFRERAWYEARDGSLPITLAYSHFTYAFGGEYINQPWREAGRGPVRELLTDPPISSRQVLAGPIFTPAERPKQEDPDEVGRPLIGAPFEEVSVLRLGAWVFEAFRDRWAKNPRELGDYRDRGFSGDVLTILRDIDSDEVAAIWRMRFDDADQAEEMLYALRDETPFAYRRIDRDVVLIASTAEEPPEALRGELQWGDRQAPEPIAEAGQTAQLCELH